MADFDPAVESFLRIRNRQGLEIFIKLLRVPGAARNAYVAHGLNANGIAAPDCRGEGAPDQAHIDQFFSDLAPHSMVRIWYLDEQNQALMDKVVASALAHHDYLTVTLVDAASGGQCGPIRPGSISNFYGGAYKNAYWTHVRAAVTRYKDSPAIGIWDMANENTNGDQMINFYNDTSALIKSIDQNHLVGTGSQPYDNGISFSSYNTMKAAQSSANIDLVSAHEYDTNTGESGWVTGEVDKLATELNKPVYVGEDGFCCGGGDAGSDGANASKLTSEYGAYLNDPLVAGVLYWNFDFQFVGEPDDHNNMNFGDALFAAEKNFRNPYPGGADGTGGTAAPTPTPTAATILGAGPYNDTVFDYSAGWQTSTDTPKYQGDDHYSDTAGATATLKFTGTGVTIYGGEASHYGNLSVAVDGRTPVTKDAYAAARQDIAPLVSITGLTNGTHTVVVTVLGTHDTNATDSVVSLDKVDVLGGSSSSVIGDVDDNGTIDVHDLSYLLSKWGSTDPTANIDGTGTVDVHDLSAMLSHWTG